MRVERDRTVDHALAEATPKVRANEEAAHSSGLSPKSVCELRGVDAWLRFR
jgi:hypothetical protein